MVCLLHWWVSALHRGLPDNGEVIRSAYGPQDGRVVIEPTQIRNDQVQSVVTTCWLADNIYQFTVMDRADVGIVEVTTDHEATAQVFAFEDRYRVCSVLQQPSARNLGGL